MTGLLPPPLADAGTESSPESSDRRRPRGVSGLWARTAADLRLARRQTLRGWTSSLLVVMLILLPMALVTGALVYAEGREPTVAERIHTQLGGADAWTAVVNGADPSLFQYLDQPEWWQIDHDDQGQPVHEPQPMPESPVPFLPAGIETIEIGVGGVMAETAGGVAPMIAVVGDAGAEVLRGRFDLHAGRAASDPAEAMVSPGALARLGARVGDTLTLTEPAGTYTITGVLSRAEDADATEVVFLPGTTQNRALQSDPLATRWYVPEWSPTPTDIQALNREGIIVFDRDLVANPGDGAAPGGQTLNWSVLAVVSAAAAFAGYLVVLLAGAAFSVSARRQQRALAVAASVGATRGDVFRIVLLQGTVLGLAGGVAGAAAGIGLGILFLHLFDDGAASTFWGVHIPWPMLAFVVGFAVLVGTLAALLPARAATKGEVIAALRGSRKPVRVRVDRPLWGTLLLVAGVAVTAAAALWLAAINAEKYVSNDDARRTICIWGIILGPLMLQVGVILAGHWIISLLSRVLSRLGLAPRLASRDAAANPGRIVPAFAAIAACAFLASVTLGGLALVTKQQERGWWYNAPVGTLSVSAWVSNDPEIDRATADEVVQKEQRSRDVVARTSPTAVGTIWKQYDPRVYDTSWNLTNPEETMISPQLQDYVPCGEHAGGECWTAGDVLTQGSWYVARVDPDEIETVVGQRLPASVLAAYRDGGAVVLDPAYVTDEGTVVLNELRTGDMENSWDRGAFDPVATTTVPAEVVDLGQHRNTTVLLSPAAAEKVGFVTAGGSWQLVAAFDEPPSDSAVDMVARDVYAMDSRAVNLGAYVEPGPSDAAPWLLLVVGATAVLVVGASAVALGLARVERRPDDATLAAVGGSRTLRRGVAGWQALIVAGIGMVTGVVAGILPVWGVSMAAATTSNPPSFSDMPWAWLVVLGVGLPAAIAAVSWLVPPRAPDLTRRTAIT
jgi:hypothetical protein